MAKKEYEKDREELEETLDLSSSRVQQNVEIITPEELGWDVQLHISTNTNIRKFIPSLTLRGSHSENRDITRVCTSPTLLGCCIGYAAVHANVMYGYSTGKAEDDGYKGGWKIYAFPFKACLKPNTKMVYDQKMSDEHWLVTYNEDTREYIPENAGRFFASAITLVPRSGKNPTTQITFYIEVSRDAGIPWSQKKWLEKGFWKLEGPGPDNVKDWKEEVYTYTNITKAEFMSAKNAHADLLSHVDNSPPKPPYASWCK